MDVPAIAKIAFTSEDRVREVIHNFNRDGFDSLAPKYAGGRPPKFSAAERAEVTKITLGRPTDYGEPFSTWSLTKLADHLVRKGVVEDISHEGLQALLREEGVSFQAIKTWKESNDPDFELRKNPSSATTSSGRSTSSRIRGAIGPSATPAVLLARPRAGGAGPPISAHTGCATSLRPMTSPPTSSTATSRPRRDGPSSWPSCATCDPSIHPRSASPSCSTTSARTSRPRKTPESATGRGLTTSSSPTARTTPAG